MSIELTELNLTALLLVAVLVAIGAAQLRLPYTVALVLTGLAAGVAHLFEISLSRALILDVFVPPLLFEAALNMDLDELKRRGTQVATLASVGTVIAAVALAAFMAAFAGLPLRFALLLSVMLAPTDPVTVLATFKEYRFASGLRTLIEGESIFNDALGVVLFGAAVQYAFPEHGGLHWEKDSLHLVSELVVGSGVGIGAGLLGHYLMRSVRDNLIETMVTIVIAFGAFLAADHLRGSGIIATVVAGLLVSNYRPTAAQSAVSREQSLLFWEVTAFLLNSVLFLLIGLSLDVPRLIERQSLEVALAACAGMLAGRAVIAYGLLAPFSTRRISVAWRHAIFWGGLRGSIPVALALGLGAQRQLGETDAVAVVFDVVLFSLLVQGLTYRPLLSRLGLIANG